MIIENLKLVIDKNSEANPLYLRNLLKEQLHYYVLNFVYNSKYSQDFVFKGGTCLRFCFDLPRLSEDLDFDVVNFNNFSFEEFVDDLEEYFVKKIKYANFSVKVSGVNKLIYIRFPVLKKVGFPVRPDKPTDDILFVRIDLSAVRGIGYETIYKVKSSYDFSFLIKSYSLPDLLAGKVAAILGRRLKEGGEFLPRFKGRDFFDVFFLLQKGVSVNFGYLSSIIGVKEKSTLKKLFNEKIKEAVKKKQYLKEDLMPFFMDQNFVQNFIDNMESFDWSINLCG